MHPKADGKPGRAKISITGFDASRPSVVVEYTERNGRSGVARLDIPKIAVDRPQTLAATVRAGRERHRAPRSAGEGGHREGRARRADQAQRRVPGRSHDDVGRTGDGGVREPEPAACRGRVSRRAGVSRPRRRSRDGRAGNTRASRAPTSSRRSNRTACPRRSPTSRSCCPRALIAASPASRPPLVQWDTPIPPPEANEILAKMSALQGSDRLQSRARAISARTSGRWI